MDRTKQSRTHIDDQLGELPDDPAVLAQRARVEAQLFGRTPTQVKVGRFSLGPVLGSGAMGVVHRGHDDVLDRDVAVKLIPTRGADAAGPQRLLREAQAMARVSHANVVAVYEAGEYARGVFVAMELVEGQTLGEWLRAEGAQCTWRERLDVVVAAGRGLAAAHRAGVVHRDFKPDNVLLTAQGEPKVSDFGLAGLVDPSFELAETTVELSAVARTAGVVGTPLYMAPEVFDGRPTDARSDQFGFCVAAYEAVFGCRPFDGPTVEALRQRVLEGEPEPGTNTAVDKKVTQALIRGLSVDPRERWPSMEALLDVLTPAAARFGWRSVLLGGVTIGGLAIAGTLWTTAPSPSPCGDGQAALDDVWSPSRRGALRESIVTRELSYAEDTWQAISPKLDDYAKRWRAQYVEACEWQRHASQSTEASARLHCLDRAQTVLNSAVERWLDPRDIEVIIHALEVVAALPDPDACADAWSSGAAGPADDPTERRVADEVADVLAESTVRRAAGEYQRAAELASQATELARGAEDPAIHAEAWYALGQAQDGLDRYPEAVRAYTEAQRHALRSSRWELTADAASSLAVASAQMKSSDVPKAQLQLAQGLAERGLPGAAQARLRRRVGAVHYLEGRYADAVTEFEAAIEAWAEVGEAGVLPGLSAHWGLGRALAADGQIERAETTQRTALARTVELYGAEHPLVAHGYTTLGLLVAQSGRLPEAIELLEQAVTLGRRTMPGHPDVGLAEATKAGLLMAQARFDEAIPLLRTLHERWQPKLSPGHPTLLTTTTNLGAALLNSGQVEAAEPILRQAVDGAVAGHGAVHPKTATTRAAWGASLQLLGRFADAEREYTSALAMIEELSGPRSALAGQLHGTLAGVVADQGRNDEAVAEYSAALSILEQTLGSEHRTLAEFRNNMATVLVAQGRLAEAEAELRIAAAASERALPHAHPNVINALTNLGDVQMKQDKLTEAVEVLERAVALIDQTQCPPQMAAEARGTLAEALDRAGGDRKRIRALARQAVVDYQRLPPGTATDAIEAITHLQ